MTSNATVASLPASYSHQFSLAADGSRTLGALLLGALVFLPHFPLRVNVDEHFGTVDFQLILRLGLCAACGLYGLAHLPLALDKLGRFPLAWMAILGVWATVTAPFAANMFQATAACGVLWCVLLFVPAVVTQLGVTRSLQTILLASVFYLVGQWALYFTVPELGRGEELLPGGEIIYRVGADSQQLGLEATALIGILLVLRRQRRISSNWFWLLLALAVVTLIGAKSRTSAIAAIAGVAFLGLRRLGSRQVAKLGAIAAASAVVLLILVATDTISVDLDSAAASVSRSGTSQEITSVTGRATIWEFVLLKITESPVIGWGYCCASAASQDFEHHLRHAHNEILNAALCLGIVGAVLLVGMFLQQIIAACTTRDELPIFVTVVTLIAGITEPVLLISMPPVLMILWIMILSRATVESPSNNTPNTPCG